MAQKAFTILEVLVTIAVLSGLLFVLLPSLGGVRDAARESISLSNLRQHGTTTVVYQGDWNGVFPYLTNPRASETIIRFPDGRPPRQLRYFDAWFGWSDALGPNYYNGYDDGSFSSPFEDRLLWGTHYWYSCSFLCRPEYWNTKTRLDGRSQWRPTRVHECIYPSNKAVFIDVTPFNQDLEEAFNQFQSIRMAFVDGSASRLVRSQTLLGYPFGDGDFSQSVHVGPGTPGLHTIDGIRGRDR